MNFAKKDLSERFQKLGCISESGFVYPPHCNEPTNDDKLWSWDPSCPNISAFCVEDFIGPTERARENCRIVWPNSIWGDGHFIGQHSWEMYRHKLIDLPTEDEFWAYIEEAIKGES